MCQDGLFCDSGICKKAATLGYVVGNDTATTVCINSFIQGDGVNTAFFCGIPTTTLKKEGEFCNGTILCEYKLQCLNEVCRMRRDIGERCHDAFGYPNCLPGLVCNLGFCVYPQSLGMYAPANNPTACATGTLNTNNPIYHYCDTCRGGVACSPFSYCSNATCVPLYSQEDPALVQHQDLCKSGKVHTGIPANGYARCVPRSREKCYSNAECTDKAGATQGLAVCVPTDKSVSNSMGVCHDFPWYPYKKMMNDFTRCLYDKDIAQGAEAMKDCQTKFLTDVPFMQNMVKYYCARYCFSRPDLQLVNMGMTINRGYVFDCDLLTYTELPAASVVTSFLRNCDKVATPLYDAGNTLSFSIALVVALALLWL
jgi:hypothetical protein